MALPPAISQAIAQDPQTSGVTWTRLFDQRHPEYDPDLWQKLRLLHEGGFAIQKNAELFIDRAPEEPEKYYKWRLKTTAYVNHMARVIGHLIGGLFGVPLKVSAQGKDPKAAASTPDDKFYDALANDCDLQGTNFSQFMRARLINALVLRRTLIGVDMPAGAGPDVVNRLQEEKLGIGRAWLYDIPLESMLDWELDELGRFKWCKLVKKIADRSDPLGDHSSYRYQFKIWRVGTTASGGDVAAYEVYETPAIKDDKELKSEEIIPRVQPLTATTFSRIPIVDVDLPAAVWAGNQLGPLCREHYNGRSDLRGSMCRNLVEIPYVKLGPEIPEVHGGISVTGSDPTRGDNMLAKVKQSGFMKIGSEDEIGFAGPSGNAFKMASEENFRVREEIYSALNTMSLALSNTGATVQRSGESKAEDRSATGVILDFLADTAREISEMTYDMVADGRGDNLNSGKVVWKASGVDSYDDDDRSALIGEAVEVDTLVIPSKTFRKVYLKSLVARLNPKSSDAEKEMMFDEIDANVTDEMVMPPKPVLDMAAGTGGLPPKKGPGVPPAKPAPTSLPPRPPQPGKKEI